MKSISFNGCNIGNSHWMVVNVLNIDGEQLAVIHHGEAFKLFWVLPLLTLCMSACCQGWSSMKINKYKYNTDIKNGIDYWLPNRVSLFTHHVKRWQIIMGDRHDKIGCFRIKENEILSISFF